MSELKRAVQPPNPPSSLAGKAAMTSSHLLRKTLVSKHECLGIEQSFNCVQSTMLNGQLKPSNKSFLYILGLLNIDLKSYSN